MNLLTHLPHPSPILLIGQVVIPRIIFLVLIERRIKKCKVYGFDIWCVVEATTSNHRDARLFSLYARFSEILTDYGNPKAIGFCFIS